MKLTKRDNITDELEREQYEFLVKVCEDAKRNAGTRPSDVHSALFMVWRAFDAYRQAAILEQPPEHLRIDPLVASWPQIRAKCKLAAEAYAELMEVVRTP